MKTVPLRRLARMRYGDALSADERRPGPVPVMSSGGITGQHDEHNTGAPAIVVGRKGSHGSLFWTDEPAFVIDTAYSIDEATTNVDLRWLFYALSTLRLSDLSNDVGVPGLSRSAAYDAQLPLVPIGEQRRIADFLDDRVSRIDRIIAARERQLGTLRDLHLAALEAMVSESGQQQRLAQLLTMGAVGVVVNPSSYFQSEGVPFVHGYNVREGYLDLSGVKFMSSADSISLDRSRLRADDVLVVRAGYPGRAAVVPPELEGGNCASVLLLRPGPKLSPHWLAAFLNSPQGKAQVQRVQYGAAQGVINLSDVMAFTIPVPARASQQERLDRQERVDDQCRVGRILLESQIDALTEYKSSLITAAVTGELDVSTAGSSIPG